MIAGIGGQPGIEFGTHLPGWIRLETDQPVGSFRFDIVRGHLAVFTIESRRSGKK
jgi:hypothetical protein